MSSGGVEPETVTRLWEHKQSGLLTRHDPQWRNGADQWSEPCEFVPLSALRLVEEELRQAREERDNWKERAGANDQDREDESQLRAEAEANWQRESALLRRAEADLDLLNRRFALVADRSGVRAQALQLAQECITENVANGEGVDSQPAVLDAIFDALKYEIADEPDGARPGAKPPIQSTSESGGV